MRKTFISVLVALASPALADAPVVRDISATQNGETWTFNVTLAHPDTGEAHYADAWEILDSEGNLLGQRILAHPHVDEQPFTRSLANVHIPEGLTEVSIRARCSRDGWFDAPFDYILPR